MTRRLRLPGAGFGPRLSAVSGALMVAAAVTASDARAWVPGDPHLDTTPRTAAEADRIARVIEAPTDFTMPEPFEENPGGAATVRARTTADAFSQPSANIDFAHELDFKVGNGLFRKLWVSSPASTLASDGLGPLYNARGCQNCHFKDGRGHPPEGPEDAAVSMFLRVSIPADADPLMADVADYVATAPDPVYGGQLQDFGTPGHPAEYRLEVRYDEVPVNLNGGEVVTLRAPTYRAADLGYGPLHAAAMLSPRVAPQMIGLGLLEAIPAADILALADPEDADGDGISGRANVVWSREYERPMLGRFGLKAGMPTIREQSAAAFSGDMGLSTALYPAHSGDCSAAQADCRAAPHGAAEGEAEVTEETLDLVTFYSRNLAVPARRDLADPEVLRGKEVFHDSGCASCHRPKFVTHRLPDRPEQSFQLIWPHTDMLLHDMGPALADNRPEGRASGREWRTAPLWGIGLTARVSGGENYLHDGRARTLLEAVLWHGGEGQAARDAVVAMPAPDRAALIRYLESL